MLQSCKGFTRNGCIDNVNDPAEQIDSDHAHKQMYQHKWCRLCGSYRSADSHNKRDVQQITGKAALCKDVDNLTLKVNLQCSKEKKNGFQNQNRIAVCPGYRGVCKAPQPPRHKGKDNLIGGSDSLRQAPMQYTSKKFTTV